jgi:anaerobic ribonucleoside-triphosphate reductase activating protein
MGGEWHLAQLNAFLKIARKLKYKTALYTGLEKIPKVLEQNLDFAKLGPWNPALGGLASPMTNQIFLDLNKKQILNHLFQPPS